MGKFVFSKNSINKMAGVHPLLVDTVGLALQKSEVDFSVIEGTRTVERQKMLVATGKSKTMNSRHLYQPDGYGHAVDLAPFINGSINWNDLGAFRKISVAMFAAAKETGLRLRWGNDWDGDGIEVGPDPDESFQDWPHYEIRR